MPDRKLPSGAPTGDRHPPVPGTLADRRTGGPKGLRLSGINILLVAASMVAALGALELGVRVFLPVPIFAPTPDFYSPAPEIGYALKPNAVKRVKMREFDYVIETNSKGFRGPEFADFPPPDVTRILLVGDSFTFGWGVNYEHTYGAVLERALNNPTNGRRHEVINGGVPGFSTLNELLFLKHRGLSVRPRIVLLQLLLNDDIEHNLTRPVNYRSVIDHTLVTTDSVERVRTTLPAGREVTVEDIVNYEMAQESRPLYERLKAPLLKHSHLYRFIVERVPTERVEALKQHLRRLGFAIQHDDVEHLSRASIEVYEEPIPPRMAAAFDATYGYLREMKFLLSREHVDLVVVVFPGLFEVDRKKRLRLLTRLDVDEERISLVGARSRLMEFCQAEGIWLLDLFPVVQRAYERGIQPFFPIDGHFNEVGNRLAGEAIAEFLKANGLLGGAAEPE